MGTTLSVTTGLGFAVPPAIVTAYQEAHEGDSFYEYLDDLIGHNGPLEHAAAWYYDYTPAQDDKPAYAVFLKSTVATNYGAGVFPTNNKLVVTDDLESYSEILELADTLGVKVNKLEWLTVVSIG